MALNYQTEDKENHYNRAMFSGNGRCGFVLKPEFLRDPGIKYSPLSPSGLPKKQFPSWRLNIEVKNLSAFTPTR